MKEKPDWKHQFEPRDFLDVRVLVAKLLNPPDEPVREVARRISPEVLALLAALNHGGTEEKRLIAILLPEFNHLIRGPLLLDDAIREQMELRQVTKKWLARQPTGKPLIRLNKLQLQDVFPVELLHEGSDPEGTEIRQGVQFRLYRVRRVGKKRVTDHYQAIYIGPAGRKSVWATSRAKLDLKIAILAKRLLDGDAPLNKSQWDLHLRNSKAYIGITKAVAAAGISGEEQVLRFISDVAQAQLAIGTNRPLLSFVHQAIEVMPKKVDYQGLEKTFPKYTVYCKHGRIVDPRTLQVKLSLIERFVFGMPQAEHIAEILIEKQANSLRERSSMRLTDDVFRSELEAAREQAGNQHRSLYCHEITSLGIEVWLRLQDWSKTNRRKSLSAIRTFFRFLRDHEHAIPQNFKTVADLVPMPEAERRHEPVSILWFDEIWEIFLNLQDQAAVFFLALGVFAGLHQSEIHALKWEDVHWENEELKVRSFKGPPGPKGVKPRYIRILYPLNRILALGRGRKGPIVERRCKPRSYLPIHSVARRLGIQWDDSIMRHTAASFLLSAGLSLADVAAYLGDLEETLSRWYLRRLPQNLASLHWSLPFSTKIFAHLPRQQTHYDCTLPFKRLDLPGKNVRDFVREESSDGASKTRAKWRIVCPTTYLPLELAYRGPKRRYIRTGRKWPTDLEFQVMLWEKTPIEIATELGTTRDMVACHAKRGDFLKPDENYWRENWRRRDAALPLPWPPLIKRLKRLLEQQQDELAKNGKVVMPFARGEKNTDPEAAITPFGVRVEGKGLLPAPRRQTPLVRAA